MNCCPTEAPFDERESTETVINDRLIERCESCGGQSRPVSRKTVLLMIKPHLPEQAMTATYSFCAARECPVVYFEEQGSHKFTIDDLRVRVGIKESGEPIPLCYCFGFDESHIRDEISKTGETTIPKRISALIREGLCACESRNPAGVCCLGEVNSAVKRLTGKKAVIRRAPTKRRFST